MVKKALDIAGNHRLLDEAKGSPPALKRGIPRDNSVLDARVRTLLGLLDHYGIRNHKQKWLLLAIALAAKHPAFHPALRPPGRPRTIEDRARLYETIRAIETVADGGINPTVDDENLRRLVDAIGAELRFNKRRVSKICERLNFMTASPWCGTGAETIRGAFNLQKRLVQRLTSTIGNLDG